MQVVEEQQQPLLFDPLEPRPGQAGVEAMNTELTPAQVEELIKHESALRADDTAAQSHDLPELRVETMFQTKGQGMGDIDKDGDGLISLPELTAETAKVLAGVNQLRRQKLLLAERKDIDAMRKVESVFFHAG
jgi:hypothetical protein